MKKVSLLIACAAVVAVASIGCGNNAAQSSNVSGLKTTPSMSQAQLDAQVQKAKAFQAMKKGNP